MKLTNTTFNTQTFIVGVKDGEALTESLKPGETRAINVREDDPTLVAQAFVGATLIEGKHAGTTKAMKANFAPAEPEPQTHSE